MTYPGGKGNSYHHIINLIPPHDTYIEPFAGGAAIAQAKRPAKKNILIDIDLEVVRKLSPIISTEPLPDHWEIKNVDAIEWLDWFRFNPKSVDPNTFIYLDPPYPMSTRRSERDLYTHEMSDEQHQQLLAIITQLPCRVMISSYWSEMYSQALEDWYIYNYQSVTRGGTIANEYLWMNYPEPTRLHDYRYLGENFRERERIKRKAKRWLNRFEGLPILERRAIMRELSEAGLCD